VGLDGRAHGLVPVTKEELKQFAQDAISGRSVFDASGYIAQGYLDLYAQLEVAQKRVKALETSLESADCDVAACLELHGL
jgi:hypothetical protein